MGALGPRGASDVRIASIAELARAWPLSPKKNSSDSYASNYASRFRRLPPSAKNLKMSTLRHVDS